MIAQRLKPHRLAFNLKEKNYMTLSNLDVPDSVSVVLIDAYLTQVSKIKLLEVILDERLNFKEHKKIFHSKLARTVGVM